MSPETAYLGANILALRAITVQICRQLSLTSPEIDRAIRDAFDKASSKVEDTAIIMGERVPPEYTVEALRIVEDTRTAVFSGKR